MEELTTVGDQASPACDTQDDMDERVSQYIKEVRKEFGAEKYKYATRMLAIGMATGNELIEQFVIDANTRYEGDAQAAQDYLKKLIAMFHDACTKIRDAS